MKREVHRQLTTTQFDTPYTHLHSLYEYTHLHSLDVDAARRSDRPHAEAQMWRQAHRRAAACSARHAGRACAWAEARPGGGLTLHRRLCWLLSSAI